jgi:hypothetical protein
LPLTLTGSRAVFDCARAASSKPQLQKAMPLAAAPFKKFRRVVMDRILAFPPAGRLTCRLILHFVADHIAKLDAEGQSFST